MERLTIKATPILTLNSKQDWINKVPNRLPVKTRAGEIFLFVDKLGNVFETGWDFQVSEKINSYPCTVYKLMSVSEFALPIDGKEVEGE